MCSDNVLTIIVWDFIEIAKKTLKVTIYYLDIS